MAPFTTSPQRNIGIFLRRTLRNMNRFSAATAPLASQKANWSRLMLTLSKSWMATCCFNTAKVSATILTRTRKAISLKQMRIGPHSWRKTQNELTLSYGLRLHLHAGENGKPLQAAPRPELDLPSCGSTDPVANALFQIQRRGRVRL